HAIMKNFYQTAVDSLIQNPTVAEWPTLANVLQRAALRAPIAWQLPVLSCQAVGGQGQAAMPAVRAFTCIHISILLVDDMLDEDPRGEHLQIGIGPAANLALALSALASQVLLEDQDQIRAQTALAALTRMQFELSRGQDLDAQNPGTEEAYWQIAHAKSGVYFGAALYLGALYGGADPPICNQLDAFGQIYGEIMQIHNDLNDSLEENPGPDWLQQRYSLPILFACVVEHPDLARFLELRAAIQSPGALQEAQAILVRCGAISYSVNELVKRAAQARALLESIPLAERADLAKLLDETIEPVEKLFEKVGAEFSTEAF
ncbi:MAG: polyprenyl synthetase family protein, partial [Chloroflexi bacterium]|nr:polyprenyl synthetase family protein [Chloroflexota bacterium]